KERRKGQKNKRKRKGRRQGKLRNCSHSSKQFLISVILLRLLLGFWARDSRIVHSLFL
ncbi:unnamed protein product, partial [Musa textilis]